MFKEDQKWSSCFKQEIKKFLDLIIVFVKILDKHFEMSSFKSNLFDLFLFLFDIALRSKISHIDT